MRKTLFPALALILAACTDKPPPPPPPPAAAPAPAASAAPSSTHPDSFMVRFTTSKGDVDLKVIRDWAPLGADRFYDLVQDKYYDDARFYRVVAGFMAQFGFAADPKMSAKWGPKPINDEPVKKSNTRGMVSYAKPGMPNSRTTQLFINYANNAQLDGMGFSPFATVTKGMDVVDKLYNGYGEQGPDQQLLSAQGNAYATKSFPKLDYIQTARVVQEWKKP